MNNIEIGKKVCSVLSCNDKQQIISTFQKFSNEDFYALYQFLVFFNLVPIFYSKVHKVFKDIKISENLHEELRFKYLKNRAMVFKRSQQLKEMLTKLNSQKVDVIPLKGVYLAEKVYENSAERIMSDIDILIREENIEQTVDILSKIGYKPLGKYSYESLKKYSKHHISPFIKPGNRSVEPHFNLTSYSQYIKPEVDIGGVWERSYDIELLDTACKALSTEDLILHLSIHIVIDKFQQKILHFYDLVLILEKIHIDWETVIKRAFEWKVNKAVYCVFLSLNNIFHCNISNDVLNSLAPKGKILENLDKILESKIFNMPSGERSSNVIVDAFSSRGVIEKIKYLWYTTCSKKSLSYQYGLKPNSWKFVIYFFHRCGVLYKKHYKSFINLYLFDSRKRNDLINKEKKNIDLESWLRK